MLEFFLAWLPLLLGVLLIIYGYYTLLQRPEFWGKPIAVVWVAGLVICLLAAYRDGFGFSDQTVLLFNGLPALIFSFLGITITLLAGSTLFVKSQNYRYQVFRIVVVLMSVKFFAMEAIRLLGR